MMARLLERFFLFICAREVLIVMGVGVMLAMVPIVMEQAHFLRLHWAVAADGEAVEDMERMIDGIAGLLVAAGVFFESREPLRKMALHHAEERAPLQLRLNEVAHHNGMGLLLVGLFMEIGTALIGMPARIVNMHGAERWVFAVCLLLMAVALLILADLVKDFVRTYFGTR